MWKIMLFVNYFTTWGVNSTLIQWLTEEKRKTIPLVEREKQLCDILREFVSLRSKKNLFNMKFSGNNYVLYSSHKGIYIKHSLSLFLNVIQ